MDVLNLARAYFGSDWPKGNKKTAVAGGFSSSHCINRPGWGAQYLGAKTAAYLRCHGASPRCLATNHRAADNFHTRFHYGAICGALHPQVLHFRKVPFRSALFHITAAHIPSMVTIAAGRLPRGRYVPPDDSDRAATLRAKNLMKLSHALIQMPFKAGADLTPCFCMQIGPRISFVTRTARQHPDLSNGGKT